MRIVIVLCILLGACAHRAPKEEMTEVAPAEPLAPQPVDQLEAHRRSETAIRLHRLREELVLLQARRRSAEFEMQNVRARPIPQTETPQDLLRDARVLALKLELQRLEEQEQEAEAEIQRLSVEQL